MVLGSRGDWRLRASWQRERSPDKRRLVQPDVVVRTRGESPYLLSALQSDFVDRKVVVRLGTIGAASHFSHRPACGGCARRLKLDHAAMRELNEERPRLPQTLKERANLRSPIRPAHIGLANFPDGVGSPQSAERLGIVVVHGVGELSREVAYVCLGDNPI